MGPAEQNDWNEAAADMSRDEWAWIDLVIGGLGALIFLALVGYV